PNIIKAKVGDEILLNISNIDIVHAFDIDELGIHEILPAGNVAVVKFVAEKAGTFEFYCQVPGHIEAGMKGILIVE
ncbi:MAG: cytochrome C oxidase subunit II, partial [Bdellovibrio sp. CG10_big_fil_rev_8_21_14_0_10_47_8]